MMNVSTRHRFSTLAISNTDQLIFGRAVYPVHCGFNLTIGSGEVYPEINFTLPTMSIDTSTWSNIRQQYDDIGRMIVKAAKRLHLPGLVVEFELLPPMTANPEWGAELTGILYSHLNRAHEEFGLRSALRVTPTDIRDAVRPPLLRSGKEWDAMQRSFELCTKSGAHILSIESVGGKEVNDEAMMYGDVAGAIFALGVLAPRDMEFLWNRIVDIAEMEGIVAGGDTACGFANTAMQLAHQGMLPEVLAAVIRAASAVRSLVAVECGAVGPSKDCAYEGPILKAITGIPISMEGKSASCAHFSPVGNIAGAMADLWSNESVQNVRLLSGFAPEAFLELLAYDCRLFNEATRKGQIEVYRDLLVGSDSLLSPQALVISPESTIRIASAIVHQESYYHRTCAAAREALTIVREAVDGRLLQLNKQEQSWMQKIAKALDRLPDNEVELLGMMTDTYGHLFRPASYGL